MEPKETNPTPDALDSPAEDLNQTAADPSEAEEDKVLQDESERSDQPLLGQLVRRAKQSKEDIGQEVYQSVRSLATIMAVLILCFTFVARVIMVSGPSMENTLHDGNVVLIWCLAYAPKQGDIVVLTQQSFLEDSIIKRVIATGGQHVDIDYDRGTVSVDGVVLEEPYIKEAMRVPAYGASNTSVTVPEGCIFVMGDNRNNSEDSRSQYLGFVDSRCVLGKAVFQLFPFSDIHFL